MVKRILKMMKLLMSQSLIYRLKIRIRIRLIWRRKRIKCCMMTDWLILCDFFVYLLIFFIKLKNWLKWHFDFSYLNFNKKIWRKIFKKRNLRINYWLSITAIIIFDIEIKKLLNDIRNQLLIIKRGNLTPWNQD